MREGGVAERKSSRKGETNLVVKQLEKLAFRCTEKFEVCVLKLAAKTITALVERYLNLALKYHETCNTETIRRIKSGLPPYITFTQIGQSPCLISVGQSELTVG